ncbi:SUN2 protein, partial [Rhinoptilus africanus]|nr:SUN2 protein [Rhinoptilus africanus]
ISPGYCWPFQASQSQVDIRFPAQVRPMVITVQHPLKKSSGLGDISSAPLKFHRLTALLRFISKGVSEEGGEETLLGTFSFSIEKEPTQTFPLQVREVGFRCIRLLVLSNWGQASYTCIYRVQVTGR